MAHLPPFTSCIFGLLFAAVVFEQFPSAVARTRTRARLDLDALTSRGSFEQIAERVAERLEWNARHLETRLREVVGGDDEGDALVAGPHPDSHSELRFEPAASGRAGRAPPSRWQQRVRSDTASGSFSGARAHDEREVNQLESGASLSRQRLYRRVRKAVSLVQRALRSGRADLLPEYIREQVAPVEPTQNVARCLLCDILVKALHRVALSDQHKILNKTTRACSWMQIEAPDVCEGINNLYEPSELYVIGHTVLSPEQVCGVIFGFGSSGCGGEPYNPRVQWNVSLPLRPKPPLRPFVQPPPDAPRMRILVLNDVHMDLHYQPGANADCGRPICCRDIDGAPPPGVEGVGFWGDYRMCDMPRWTVESMLAHIAAEHKFDLIYWLGDLPTHHVWNQSREDHLDVHRVFFQLLAKYFPNARVYSTIGNHEGLPTNIFPTAGAPANRFSMQWFYKYLASREGWGRWLPVEDPKVRRDIERLGSYSVLVRPGFRLIGFNNNYGHRSNYFVYLNPVDPQDALAWLVDELQHAEDHNELVHLLVHIPPGFSATRSTSVGEPSGVYPVWGENYARIVARYESTIRAQFYGHTHKDHFEVFYDDYEASGSGRERPVSVAHILPSATTEPHENSAFTMLTVDGVRPNSTWGVLDQEVYILNISRANEDNVTVWNKEYSFAEAYGIPNMFPATMNELTVRLAIDPKLFDKFMTYYYKSAPNEPLCRGIACRLAVVCSLRTVILGNDQHCTF